MTDSVHLAAGDGDEDFRQGRASSDAAPSAEPQMADLQAALTEGERERAELLARRGNVK